jgi:sugar lactone lactonase YvrE
MMQVVGPEKVELVLDAGADLGEGPVWDEERGELLWVDMFPGLLHRFSPDTRQDCVVEVGQTIGSLALRSRGGYVLALREGLYATSAAGDVEALLPIDVERTDTFLNDSRCDPSGSLWVGSTTDAESGGSGTLYSISPGLELKQVLANLSVPNGLDWSPDGGLLYLVESHTGEILVYPFSSLSTLGEPQVLTRVSQAIGVPDGLVVDAEGYLWVALWGGGQVQRYTPEGVLDTVIQLPVAQVSSCTFGGSEYRDLYITTGAYALSAEELQEQPLAGALFRVSSLARGLPPRRFNG